MIVYIGDLSFKRGVMTPAGSWAHVDFAEPDETALTFGECETCGATIADGDPMLCDECAPMA